jgi:hypothetical protein
MKGARYEAQGRRYEVKGEGARNNVQGARGKEQGTRSEERGEAKGGKTGCNRLEAALQSKPEIYIGMMEVLS